MKSDLMQLASKKFTRRSFLEGMGAVGATAALASCGSGQGVKTLFGEAPAPAIPAIGGTLVAGSAPHNCGGRCVTKAYVENGVIKRFITDDRPDQNVIDGTGDDPQRRGCLKCRGQKGFMYRADRLLHPLKQTGTRGDVNGFVQISWTQAFTEIAQKLQSIVSDSSKGWKTLHSTYASGSSGSFPSAQQGRLLDMLGGQMKYRQSYSYPGYAQVGAFVLGNGESYQQANMRQDLFNASQLVLWSFNPGDTVMGVNTMWYLQQAREKGIPIISIDSRINQTTAAIATQKVMVVPGTDSALIAGMMYHLLAEPSLDGSKPAGSMLDDKFIRTYVHGFFDDLAPTMYHSDGPSPSSAAPTSPKTSYIVPPGASLSAYIMGSNRFLVDGPTAANPTGKTWNLATSIYPDTIGYNYVAPDPLAGQTTKIWGNVPKTPEWAEKICGVPANTIRALAESFADPRIATTAWFGGGIQRTYEQEQAIWMCWILSHITGNFGAPGRSFGFYSDRSNAGNLTTNTVLPAVSPAGQVTPLRYDTSKLSSTKWTSSWAQNNFPVFLWSDIAKNGGTGKSDWNDPQVMSAPAMKVILNFGGNILVNQTGDSIGRKAILADKTKVELIVVADHYMTASATMADYVLPAATAWEKSNYTTTSYAGEQILSMGKAVDPLGEALEDFSIVSGIANQLGLLDKFAGGHADWTSEQWVKGAYNASAVAQKMSYDDWKASGIYSSSNPNAPLVPAYKAYRGNTAAAHGDAAAAASAAKSTPSGKVEAFSQAMVEDYCARGYNNLDPSFTLGNGATLFDPNNYTATDRTIQSPYGRFVYPIPMYIPLYEGIHANESPSTGDLSQAGTGGLPCPDPLGLRQQGFNCLLNVFHTYYRSHSTHNNNAFVNEIYKRDARGQPAFLHPKNRTSLATWDDGVYEPIWINPATARQFGIAHGDRVLVTSKYGKVYASANVTQRCQLRVVHIAQGSWHQLNSAGVDVGGCVNTLLSARPSRIGQGMTGGNGLLVNIQKA
jgi:anaerobic dimethyl sulfoxide reductase subunit A